MTKMHDTEIRHASRDKVLGFMAALYAESKDYQNADGCLLELLAHVAFVPLLAGEQRLPS